MLLNKINISTIFLTVFLLSFAIILSETYAASVPVGIGNVSFKKKAVRSLKDIKFESINRQQKDYSCGAAAVSTLLSYYFGINTTEDEILKFILKDADETKKKEVKKKGVSLLDIKKYVEHIGLDAAGYKVPQDLLNTLDRPAIALVKYKGYSHFVVLKGFIGRKAYIADPARGNLVWDIDEFTERWNGILLVLTSPNGEKIDSHSLMAGSHLANKSKIGLLNKHDYLRFVIGPSEF